MSGFVVAIGSGRMVADALLDCCWTVLLVVVAVAALVLGGDLLEDEEAELDVEVHEDWEEDELDVSMVETIVVSCFGLLLFGTGCCCCCVLSLDLLAWILMGKWLLSAFLARMLDELMGLKADLELIGCCCCCN